MSGENNPVGTDKPKGKDCSERKGRYDGGWTGTEQRIKNKLMRQFMRGSAEGPGGNSETYRNNYDAIDWSK